MHQLRLPGLLFSTNALTEYDVRRSHTGYNADNYTFEDMAYKAYQPKGWLKYTQVLLRDQLLPNLLYIASQATLLHALACTKAHHALFTFLGGGLENLSCGIFACNIWCGSEVCLIFWRFML